MVARRFFEQIYGRTASRARLGLRPWSPAVDMQQDAIRGGVDRRSVAGAGAGEYTLVIRIIVHDDLFDVQERVAKGRWAIGAVAARTRITGPIVAERLNRWPYVGWPLRHGIEIGRGGGGAPSPPEPTGAGPLLTVA